MGYIAVQIPQDKGLVNVNGCMQTLGFLIDSLTFGIRSKQFYAWLDGGCHPDKYLYAEWFSISLPLHMGGQADLSLSMTILI